MVTVDGGRCSTVRGYCLPAPPATRAGSSHPPLRWAGTKTIPMSQADIGPFKKLYRAHTRDIGGFERFCIEHKKLVFNNFWLFLRSLSYIGSSGRLLGRFSPSVVKIRGNLSPYAQKLIVVKCSKNK